MGEVRYLLFDAANTLIHKPSLWDRFLGVFDNFEIKVPLDRLKYHHKLLSEFIDFPDRTSEAFYYDFNRELLLSLGIRPDDEILAAIFNACTYLPWQPFEDTQWIRNSKLRVGVLSNFNKSLPQLLNNLIGDVFTDIFVSEELGKRKPELAFFQHALELIDAKSEEILYIGDSFKLDILPALQVGMNPLLIDRLGIYDGNEYAINSIFDIDKYI